MFMIHFPLYDFVAETVLNYLGWQKPEAKFLLRDDKLTVARAKHTGKNALESELASPPHSG